MSLNVSVLCPPVSPVRSETEQSDVLHAYQVGSKVKDNPVGPIYDETSTPHHLPITPVPPFKL